MKGPIGANGVWRDVRFVEPSPASDPEYEREQPVTRDDRRAMLHRHFAASGMSEAQIEAHLSKAKV